ncbi:Na-translocating system protein MpsC family protein [Peribacillus sp. AS_2]|uniref:Na-translocating system protein MpsC family protein n=1 Tax=Peribacillus sp. AS_2 TaxID=2996755 RepID=UPI0022A6E44E|nr:Na-translocating system protein MpsC family protein [Peribacillus sp. AS_2]MCZ0875294.1 Na-translocating system protein MpsC family protein [Peribacillus sp. AS_2]
MYLTDTNESKKKLTNLYNEVCKGLFGAGTTLLKIEIDERFITFRTKHRRTPQSLALESEVPALKREVDFQMSQIFKKRMKEILEQDLNLKIEVILRDYDYVTQWSITEVILSENS